MDELRDCKFIEVRHSPNNVWAIVDAPDYEKATTYTWWLTRGYPSHSYKVKGRCYSIYLGRYLTDCPDDKVISYLNLDPLDCRRSNLLVCSKSQQLMNMPERGGRCGFKGVFKQRRQWVARAWDEDGKRVHLGVFPTPELAGRAYDEFVRKRFGVFARYNFPGPGERPARL